MSNPSTKHMNAAKHVLRYLKKTAHFSIRYSEGKILTGYADASFSSDPDSARSVSSYVFLFNQAAISWHSKLQPVVAASTTEAEYMALYEATKETQFLMGMLDETKLIVVKEPTIIYEDNQSAIHLARNAVTSNKSKHVHRKYHLVRDAEHNPELYNITILYLETNEMIADALTKQLCSDKHLRFASKIFNNELSYRQQECD
jgi:hypothetical protein